VLAALVDLQGGLSGRRKRTLVAEVLDPLVPGADVVAQSAGIRGRVLALVAIVLNTAMLPLLVYAHLVRRLRRVTTFVAILPDSFMDIFYVSFEIVSRTG